MRFKWSKKCGNGENRENMLKKSLERLISTLQKCVVFTKIYDYWYFQFHWTKIKYFSFLFSIPSSNRNLQLFRHVFYLLHHIESLFLILLHFIHPLAQTRFHDANLLAQSTVRSTILVKPPPCVNHREGRGRGNPWKRARRAKLENEKKGVFEWNREPGGL